MGTAELVPTAQSARAVPWSGSDLDRPVPRSRLGPHPNLKLTERAAGGQPILETHP